MARRRPPIRIANDNMKSFPAIIQGGLAILFGLSVQANDRLPLKKPEWNIAVHETGIKEIKGYDPVTSEPIYCDREVSVTFDPATGNYLLRWTGYRCERIVEAVWEPRTKVDVTVSASVERSKEPGVMEYQYIVHNGDTSQQLLEILIVAAEAPFVDADAPSAEWMSCQLPERVWHGNYWEWAKVTAEPYGIAPGASESGFHVRSAGLPAIVACFAGGYAPVLKVEEEVPAIIGKALPTKLLQNCVRGVTVGPGVAPESELAVPATLLSRLCGYVPTCLEQHWISNAEVATRFSELLSRAQTALGEGSIETATGVLRQLSEETERLYQEKPPQITSETYALFRYNAEWLISRLAADVSTSSAR